MESTPYDSNKYPLQDKTNIILGIAVDIHKTLGAGFLEIVYKDAFEYEFLKGAFYLIEKSDTRSYIKT